MRGGRQRWGRLLRAAVPLAGAALLTVAYTRIDQVLVYRLSGAAEAGLYGAVYRVLDRAQLVPLAVVTTFLPMLAAAWTHDRARFGRLFQDAAEFLWDRRASTARLDARGLRAACRAAVREFGRRPRIADPDGSLCRDLARPTGGERDRRARAPAPAGHVCARGAGDQRRPQPRADSALRLPRGGVGDPRDRGGRGRARALGGDPPPRRATGAQQVCTRRARRRAHDARALGPQRAGSLACDLRRRRGRDLRPPATGPARSRPAQVARCYAEADARSSAAPPS